MVSLDALFSAPQYSLRQNEKEAALLPLLNQLTTHHREHSPEYRKLLDAVYPGASTASTLEEAPYFPVCLFKTHRLLSIPEDRIFKTLTSSGTSRQQVSPI